MVVGRVFLGGCLIFPADYAGDFYEIRYSFTNLYLFFSIAKESARVNGAISSVFLGVCFLIIFQGNFSSDSR